MKNRPCIENLGTIFNTAFDFAARCVAAGQNEQALLRCANDYAELIGSAQVGMDPETFKVAEQTLRVIYSYCGEIIKADRFNK